MNENIITGIITGIVTGLISSYIYSLIVEKCKREKCKELDNEFGWLLEYLSLVKDSDGKIRMSFKRNRQLVEFFVSNKINTRDFQTYISNSDFTSAKNFLENIKLMILQNGIENIINQIESVKLTKDVPNILFDIPEDVLHQYLVFEVEFFNFRKYGIKSHFIGLRDSK